MAPVVGRTDNAIVVYEKLIAYGGAAFGVARDVAWSARDKLARLRAGG